MAKNIDTERLLTFALSIMAVVNVDSRTRELCSAVQNGDIEKEPELEGRIYMYAYKANLHDAVVEGDLQAVKELISSGVEVNNYAGFPKQQSPLIAAIIGKNEEMVKLLLQNGASVLENTEDHFWPIHFAAVIGSDTIMELLLRQGRDVIAAQVQARTKFHRTPLLIAIEKAPTSICQVLINHGADVNAVENRKYTPVIIAANNGRVSTMELLLKNGADIRAQDVYGQTALSMASIMGHLEAVKIILPLLSPEDLMTEDEEGNTAAFMAARYMYAKFDIMELILKQGNEKQLWKSSKSTILHSINYSGNGRLTQKHCHQFRELLHQQDSNGYTPAQTALRMNNVDNFIAFVQYQPQLLETDGFTLMKLALQHAHPQIVDLIQKKKSILHTYNEWFLYLTSNTGKSQERMQILTKHIAMFSNRRQQMVNEAIANAIKNNHLDVLKKLMEWIIDFAELASVWPLWTAIDVENHDIALYLLQLDSIFQHQPGPDGSSPLQLCVIRDNKKVLTAWKNKCPDVVQTLTQSDSEKQLFRLIESIVFQYRLLTNDWNGNQYVALCKTYPMFNEQCSLPFKVGQRKEKEFSFWADSLPHTIDVSACIPTSLNDNNICFGHFGDELIRACEILSNLVRLLYRIEDELNKMDTLMKLLGPKFILIGSIAEGTRLGHPDELDMSTVFDNIKSTFFDLSPSDAFGLRLSEDGVVFFKNVQKTKAFKQLKLPLLIMKDSKFNVLAFQKLFFAALEQAIPQVELPDNVQLGISNSTFDITKCEKCIKASKDEGTWMHCVDCFPLLAQTKRGVVLNLIWNKGDIKYKCSIDLVPLYPVQEKKLSKLFGSVFQTLVEQKPAGWRGAVGKYIQIDRPVHGAFFALEKGSSNDNRPLLMAMKILNYGPGSNYIQCPGQSTGLEHFANRRIREAYLFTKGLIKVLNLSVKSYYVKKMFLNDTIIELSQTARNNAHFILSVLCQPEWGTLFTDHLDIEKMEDRAKNMFGMNFEAFIK